MTTLFKQIFGKDLFFMPYDVEFNLISTDTMDVSFEGLTAQINVYDGNVYKMNGEYICTVEELEEFDQFKKLNECWRCGGRGEYFVTIYDNDAPLDKELISCDCEKAF